ncbi:hypothetical protein MKZ38_010044 [Zalerion maritima]|uniref:Uncharacterized protein n=1 Tax=Zalerion maritima TaxID=339359 RepID=A0AAD5RG45_9PEZI|nr:hypothetical protein MKZ38_010044 [Zalerion maritima]
MDEGIGTHLVQFFHAGADTWHQLQGTLLSPIGLHFWAELLVILVPLRACTTRATWARRSIRQGGMIPQFPAQWTIHRRTCKVMERRWIMYSTSLHGYNDMSRVGMGKGRWKGTNSGIVGYKLILDYHFARSDGTRKGKYFSVRTHNPFKGTNLEKKWLFIIIGEKAAQIRVQSLNVKVRETIGGSSDASQWLGVIPSTHTQSIVFVSHAFLRFLNFKRVDVHATWADGEVLKFARTFVAYF